MDKLKNEEQLAALLADAPVALVQYGAETCGPCKAISAKITQWAADHPAVQCIYVPVEQFPQLAAAESIFTVPAVLVYVQGRLTLREIGYFGLGDLLARAQRYLELLGAEAPAEAL